MLLPGDDGGLGLGSAHSSEAGRYEYFPSQVVHLQILPPGVHHRDRCSVHDALRMQFFFRGGGGAKFLLSTNNMSSSWLIVQSVYLTITYDCILKGIGEWTDDGPIDRRICPLTELQERTEKYICLSEMNEKEEHPTPKKKNTLVKRSVGKHVYDVYSLCCTLSSIDG